MFIVNEDKSIYLTRGDVAFFSITAEKDTEEAYKFQPGDVVRFKVTERKACDKVVLSKDFGIEEETEEIEILLEEKDTKIGGVISKPVDYWYEVELNPYTDPQTIVGYDDDGAKIFKLFPEGADVKEEPITPEDIPVVDEELSLTSTRPVQNQAIYRAILKIREENAAEMERLDEFIDGKLSKVTEVEAELDRIAEETEVKLGRLDEFAEELSRFDEIEEKLERLDEFAIEDAYYNGCYYRRVGINLDQKEWINPPMVLGEEYRTTERCGRDVVYTMVIDGGELPNTSSKTIFVDKMISKIVSLNVVISDGQYSTQFPFVNRNGAPAARCYINLKSTDIGHPLVIQTFEDMSNHNATIYLKYVK